MSTDTKHSIVVRDGVVYVRAVYDGFTIPELQILYFPTTLEPRTLRAYGIESGEPIEPIDTYHGGEYRLVNHRMINGDYRRITLVDHGKTISTIVEKLPIPCPKVRAGVETRWHHGRWEKYLKTKGWVPA